MSKKSAKKPLKIEQAKLSVARVVTTAVTLVLFAAGLFLFTEFKHRKEIESLSTSLVREDRESIGPKDAKVTIVEFVDPACSASRLMEPRVQELVRSYQGKVRLIVRHYVKHRNSLLGVKALEAASEQGKYWEMLGALFSDQVQWAGEKSAPTEVVMRLASGVGLDIARFREAMDSQKIEAKIYRDRSEGGDLGVLRTPTFFVNRERVHGFGYEQLKEAVDRALHAEPASKR